MSSDLPISVAYVEGKYRAGEVCEQWRCEGIAKEVGQEAAASAPAASFAQCIPSLEDHRKALHVLVPIEVDLSNGIGVYVLPWETSNLIQLFDGSI